MRCEPSLRVCVLWSLALIATACDEPTNASPAGGSGGTAGQSTSGGIGGGGSSGAASAGVSGGASGSGGSGGSISTDDAAVPAPNDASVDDAMVPGDDDEFLGLELPSRGFRVASLGRAIAPGEDVEYCEIGELPGTPDDEYIASAFEVANGRGSHHIIISAAQPGTPADARIRARSIGEQIPCISAGSQFGTDGMITLAGAQTSYGRLDFPEGVGLRMHGGQRIVFDYHYLNTGEEAIPAKSAIAVHTTEARDDITIATGYAFTNFTLDVPPGTERTFTASCKLERDAIVMGVGRHTHRLGTDFAVWFEGGSQHGEHIWTSHDWEHELSFSFPEPRLVKAGEGFKFACGFLNEGEVPLRFGTSATDEMCILSGVMWSPTKGEELPADDCVVTWIDDEGIGRDARDAGGFPKATPDEALSCHAGYLGLGVLEGCLGCICDSCGAIMNKCNGDADCRPILECTTACMGDCKGSCDETMSAHSSAVGMITAVGECISTQCPSCAMKP